MEMVNQVLTQYGAALGMRGQIVRNEKATGVNVCIKRGRLRFESSTSGALLASGPVKQSTVEKFVESFWFWEKCN